ncbi:MAG TPA: WG repeat-containing protein, partial [Chitinophagales bacterium]|nr:WG repeat-containing protein [Chitinophagales bacterium]
MLTRNCFRVFRKHTQFLIIFIITCSAGCSGNSERLRQTFAAQNETALTAEAENEISAASADGNGFHDSADEWFVFKKNGKYGYLNPNGEWMIQPKYETAFPFIEGIALVSLDGKKFLIDSRERSVPLPDGVTDVSTFKGGLAPVTIGGKTGFINRWGKLVTQPFIDF